MVELSNQQILFIIYCIFFFYFNGLVLQQIIGSIFWSYFLSFIGTNLMMFNIIFAAREGNKYLEKMEIYIKDVTEMLQSEPDESQGEYFFRVGEIIWKWTSRTLALTFEYLLPITLTPIYFTMVSGYRIIGYMLVGPLRIFMSLIKSIEQLLRLS